MNILSCNYNHDGSAAILSNGKIKAYLNTERFSRIKKHPGVTKEVFDELFKIANITPEQIDCYILNNLNYIISPEYYIKHNGYYQNTWENFLIEDPYSGNTVDLKDYGFNFNRIDPIWKFPDWQDGKPVHEKTFATFRGIRKKCIINLPHYESHAACAYYSSQFESSMIFVWDPTGFEAYVAKGNKIYTIFNNKYFPFMANMGSVYSLVSADILSEMALTSAGKMMGLAPYGKSEFDLNTGLFFMGQDKILDLLEKESMSNSIFYQEKGKILNAKKAFFTQTLFEYQIKNIFNLLYSYANMFGIEPNICLSGGSALNCIANEKAFSNSKFKNIFLHPACGDDGTSIGGALLYWHNEMNKPKQNYKNSELMYSNKEYSKEQIIETLNYFNNKITIQYADDYIKLTADALSNGKIIGWYEGGSEIGPRALGHRSILADPRSDKVRDFLNIDVKGRETYRPLAPSILEEHSEEWFGIKDSPFMLRAAKILKDSLPGISHVDNTSRPQTVKKEDNPNYYALINTFFNKTKIPLVLNTSLNIKGEPIVETPKDAIKSFLNSKIDLLVFPKIIVRKLN